jgi:eukaryotic-like serine/threonine-protein kinase
MIGVRDPVDEAVTVPRSHGAPRLDGSGRVRRVQPAWPEEEARALAGLQDRLFASFEPPRRLHRYVLLERLGSGGGGIVYAAWDPQLDRKVAIKLLRGLADERAQLRLVREAQALAKLAHPNVVAVFDVGTYDPGDASPLVFIVMEYVDGPTLSEWLRAPRSQRAVLEQFLAAGRGLAAAHALGVVHRDFKPHNVVIGGDGRARVLDFGLSRVVAGSPTGGAPSMTIAADAHSQHSLTDAGMVMGTPAYMAPEQHLGAAVDARADQFGFCVALFEALHGQRPFVGANVDELVRAKQEGALRATTSRVPRRIERALARGLAASPDARHVDLASLLAELEPRRGRAWLWASSAIVIAVLAIAWLLDAHRSGLGICDRAREDLALVWGEPQRTAVSDAFSRSGDPDAATALAGVLAGVDRWGEAWTTVRTDACIEASTKDADQEIVRRRRVCLDHTVTAARTTIDLLASADRNTVAWSRDIVQTLPDPNRCADDEALAREAIPPDASAVESVGRVASDLVALRTRVLTGDDRRAIAIGRSAVEEADASGHPPTRIRARFALGWALSRNGDLAEAEARLREGWLLAEAQRLDDLQIRGALDLSGVLRSRGRTREADAMLEAAIAKASRSAPNRGLASDFAVQRGRSALDAGRLDRAIAEFEDALDAREAVFGSDHVAVAWTLLDLARAHVLARAPGEVRRHLRRASEILASHRPVGTLARAELLECEAQLALLEQRPADAIAGWTTIELLGDHGMLGDPVMRARARNGIAEAWLALGRTDAASTAIVDQPERCRDSLGPLHRTCVDALVLRSRVALEHGDQAMASADARTARTLADATE